MTADRTVPDQDSNPEGIAGDDYADDVRDEIEALWNGVITQTGTIGGTANAITAVSSPVLIASYANGQTFRLTPTANNSSTVTINIDGRGAKALRHEDGTALAADDLVNGTPILFWFDSAADYFRLCTRTSAELLADLAAEIAAASLWVVLGDTTTSGSVSQVEHSFTASGYTQIRMISMNCGYGTGSSGQYSATLRYASGAILTLTHTAAANARATIITNFHIDLVTGNKIHYGTSDKMESGATDLQSGASTANANVPDRARITSTGAPLANGMRVITYGLKVS